MLVKAVFLIFLVIFSIFSSLINLPPGTIVTETLNLSVPFSFLSNNLFNGVFFATIIAFVTYIFRRKTKPTLTYKSKMYTLNNEIKELSREEQKINISSNLTQIKGIGPKNALDLELAGVTTIADLAKRSPQHLAEKTGISIILISKWIVEANKIVK
ncbi:MAG: helix-hairpin-helix domain-containing protein [Candidatus Bathyarchaeota archaeon]